LLATTKQQTEHTLVEYLQKLQRLSKDCNFQAVNKTEHRDGFIRDAFINGILSHSIRHRLLEEQILTIDSTFDKARALDVTQGNSVIRFFWDLCIYSSLAPTGSLC